MLYTSVGDDAAERSFWEGLPGFPSNTAPGNGRMTRDRPSSGTVNERRQIDKIRGRIRRDEAPLW
jgi:hypothetical protein